MWDDVDVDITMNGVPFKGTKFSHGLRVCFGILVFKSFLQLRLFNEHVGLDLGNKTLMDPVSEKSFKDIFLKTCKKNTEIYEHVFPSIASNFHSTFASYQKWKDAAPNNPEKLDQVKGHIMFHPMQFLKDENSGDWKHVFVKERLFQ